MCTLSINNELNGIELVFESKPEKKILEAIKAAGFRWHNLKKLWYAKQTPERMELAQQLSGGEVATGTATTPTAPKEIVSKYGIKVGDILTGSFGYSMTIVEMWKVTKIVSPCRVEIVEIGGDLVSSDRGGGEYLMPNPEKVKGEPIIKNIVADRCYGDNAYYIKINDSCNIRPWCGGALYQNTYD